MAGRLSVRVPDAASGTRVDRFVADSSGLSRAHVQRLIAEGRLTVDGRASKASAPLEPGSTVELDVPEAPVTALSAEDVPLRVVYEDADVLIVDKPAGLVTHPSPGHRSGTLVNALLARAGGLGTVAGPDRPGIVHRLDRDTSGLIMIGRHDTAQHYLMEQLRARRVKKRYLALVHGNVAASLGRIEAPIGRDPRHRTKMAVAPDGRPSVSGYRVRERFDGWTMLELDLITGRTHQLRVHLASIGHAVAGDRVYATGPARRGPDGLDRLFLHAWKLDLLALGGEHMIQATAALPAELERVLEPLRTPGQAGMS
ncbi:MAG: RluA family pseudouridine synthase [Chloroflexi bacterium]|nr:RluA family pseudouridine synthase [Chloroflexota bacterium]